MAFFSYLDGSGSALDPKIEAVSVSGFVAHETQWQRFEELWRALLIEFDLTEFHMAHYFQRKGEFDG